MENQNNETNCTVAIAGGGMSFPIKQVLLNNLISNGRDVIITDPAHDINNPLSEAKLWEPCKTIRKYKIGECIAVENMEQLEKLINKQQA